MTPPIGRVLVLGHGGFIGGALMRRLAAERPGLDVSGKSYPEFDLTSAERARSLSGFFEPETAVVMLSAVKRQGGDTLENYLANVAMTANLCAAMEKRGPGRLIYLSSAAVYGEDAHDLAITEKTPVRLRSYYGMAKHACERLLEKTFQPKAGKGLVLLRPATVYGPGEPDAGYTPTGFLRKALAGEEIVLWGDGTELREFIYIDDLTVLLERLILGGFSGTLNIVSGRSRSFRDALDAVGALLGGVPEERSRPRSKAKADNVFVPDALKALFPGFVFTSLEDGLKKILAAEKAGAVKART